MSKQFTIDPNIDIVFERERRRSRFVQDPELRDRDFHFSSRNVRIYRVRSAALDQTFDRNNKLGA